MMIQRPEFLGERGSLLERTRQALASRDRVQTYEKISADTGLSRSWLSLMARGEIRHPSVEMVQTLYEYLTGEEL